MPPADHPPGVDPQFFKITFLRTASLLGMLVGIAVVVGPDVVGGVDTPFAVDVVVAGALVDDDVDPSLALDVVVADGALVVVEELDLVGAEEQPARMPAAPSAQITYPTRLRISWCVVPSLALRSTSGC
jgi:hypothetical protein